MKRKTELEELNMMLARQIKRRDKEIKFNGCSSKKTANQISRTRMLIEMHTKLRDIKS